MLQQYQIIFPRELLLRKCVFMAGFALVYNNKNKTMTRDISQEIVYFESRIVYIVTENTHTGSL